MPVVVRMRPQVLLLCVASLLQLAVGEYVWVNSEWVWKEDAKVTPSAGVDSAVEGSGGYDDSYDEGENEKDYEEDEYGEYGSGAKVNSKNNRDWTEKATTPPPKKKGQKGGGGGGKGAATEPTFNNMNQNVFGGGGGKKADDIGFHEEAGGTTTTLTTPRVVVTVVPPAQDPAVTTGVSSVERNPNSHSTSFFAQPGILAAVIGGAVVGLLCAILLVMFIVYRMRKKDEGSYALDEPRRSPNVHLYSKAPTREFFA